MKTVTAIVLALVLAVVPAMTCEAKSKPPVKSPTSRVGTLSGHPAFAR